jgi:hypothetical protein
MKHSRKFMPIVLGTCLLIAASCGTDDDDSSASAPAPQPEEQLPDEGTYTATLTTLNAGVDGNQATGTATITIENEQITVDLNMDGTPDRIIHPQHIHAGSACPNITADANADGFIDFQESLPDIGPILVPLDGDLASQTGGSNGFPMADNNGSYTYSQSASFTQMIDELRQADQDPNDSTARIPEGENLNLDGRHITIHGVSGDANLPDSVASDGDQPAEATLPIACGQIVRSDDTGTTTGDIGTTTGDIGTTTGDTGTTTGDTGTTTGDTGTTTGDTGTTTGDTGTGTTTGDTGTGTTTGDTGTTTGDTGTGTTTGI